MRRRWGPLLVVPVVLLLALAAPGSRHAGSGKRLTPPETVNGSYSQEFQYECSSDELSFDKWGEFDTISIGPIGAHSSHGKPGHPRLPTIEIKIAVPYDVEVTGLRILDVSRSTVPGSYYLAPGGVPVRTDGSSSPKRLGVDEEIYSAPGPYPADVLSSPVQIAGRGQGYVVVGFHPVQYMPSKRLLTFFSKVSFILEGVAGNIVCETIPADIRPEAKIKYENMLKEIVINPEDVALAYSVLVK